jgi:predicted TIM-barrel fold metal-dependent hydrolase
MEIRKEWLSLVDEEVIEPERRIIDAHHHLFDGSEFFPDYRLEDLWQDTGSGHRIEGTVFVDCAVGYRQEGPSELAPVGETEYVARVAAEAARSPERAQIRAIVSHVELSLGERARRVLEAHLEASPLFRGIRDSASWDATEGVPCSEVATDEKLYLEPEFRKGFAELAKLQLTYDAYNYHTQTRYLVDLARAFPDTTIVFNHLGSPLGVGPYAGRREEIFAQWKRDLSELASCRNVVAKLGGMAMPWVGFGWEDREQPPTSDELVASQKPYLLHAIEAFGPERCMFESNFPVEKICVSYRVVWNAFKKMVTDFSEDEKDAMFRGTASRVYRLEAAV